jgi:hypothetical protein
VFGAEIVKDLFSSYEQQMRSGSIHISLHLFKNLAAHFSTKKKNGYPWIGS